MEEEESKEDVPDLLSVDQLTPIDESTVKIEIKEEPLSDINEEPVLPFMKEEPLDEQDPETIDQLDKSDRESIQMFFDSVARTVMTLSPSFVTRIKLEVLRVITDIEMEAHKENMEQSKEPSRNANNATATSKEPEPKIKIEIEDDEDTETLNEPDEPDLSDLNRETNLEHSTKKTIKSETAQPTSTSALMVDKLPRSQHETFFQNIAYTVTSFPPPLAPFAFHTKVAVLKVDSNMQEEACRSRRNGCQDGEGKAYTKRPFIKMDEENQTYDKLNRTRELTYARVKKYRKRKQSEFEQLNSSMQDYPIEQTENMQIEEKNVEQKRAMAMERLKRYREKKQVRQIEEKHVEQKRAMARERSRRYREKKKKMQIEEKNIEQERAMARERSRRYRERLKYVHNVCDS